MVARIRELSDQKVYPYFWSYTSSPTSGYDSITGTLSLDAWHEYQQIVDVSRSRASVKPVEHRKVFYFPLTEIEDVHDVDNPWYHQRLNSGDHHVYPPLGIRNQSNHDCGPLSPTAGQVAELADSAFDAFYTQVPQEVDVTNFLLDFREVESLIPKIEKSVHETIASGFLNWSFGWSPTISDIRKLSSIVSTVQRRLAWLKSTYGKRTPLGFSAAWSPPLGGPVSASPTSNGLVYTNLSVSGSFVAGCYLVHRLQDLDGMIGEARALVAALGLNRPGGIVWERIPFSFILDWVSRVGRYVKGIGQFQPFVGDWDLFDVTHSFKARAEYDVHFAPSAGLSWRGLHVGRLTYEWYKRDRGLPLSAELFYGRELNPQQLALSAALITGAVSR